LVEGGNNVSVAVTVADRVAVEIVIVTSPDPEIVSERIGKTLEVMKVVTTTDGAGVVDELDCGVTPGVDAKVVVPGEVTGVFSAVLVDEEVFGVGIAGLCGGPVG
jgi:hypothetical protein